MVNKLEEATRLALEGKLQENEKPTTLYDILQMMGAKEPIADNGELSDEGVVAEKKLYDLLVGLDYIGVIDFDADKYDKEINDIINE